MTKCFVTLFRLKMHMILFLDSLVDVACTYYCVARVTCLVGITSDGSDGRAFGLHSKVTGFESHLIFFN